MRRLIIVLVILISFFLANLIFFSFSDNYKFFIKKLKNPNSVVYVKDKVLLDEVDDNKNKVIINNTGSIVNNNPVVLEKGEDKLIVNTNTGQTVLGKQYKDILDKFSYYNLSKLELPGSLFDLTQEYPDDYYEYYSKDLTIYFFVTKSYNEVLDVFQVLTYDLPFTINKTNTFGDSSFFINLKGGEKEGFVRMVTSVKGFVFGLKFKKDQYNKIKDILKSIGTVDNLNKNLENSKIGENTILNK